VGYPRFEIPAGVIDGSNRTYTVSAAYRVQSTAVFVNGQLQRADFADGWSEVNPEAGVLLLTEAPLEGDVLQVFFINSGEGDLPESEVTPLKGTLKTTDDLSGRLVMASELRGLVAETNVLFGRALPTGTISATVVEVERLYGTVGTCQWA
jgi:hypothetical protein